MHWTVVRVERLEAKEGIPFSHRLMSSGHSCISSCVTLTLPPLHLIIWGRLQIKHLQCLGVASLVSVEDVEETGGIS